MANGAQLACKWQVTGPTNGEGSGETPPPPTPFATYLVRVGTGVGHMGIVHIRMLGTYVGLKRLLSLRLARFSLSLSLSY